VTERIWEELIRSPLDPDPDEEAPFLAQFALITLLAILGFVVGRVIFASNDDERTAISPRLPQRPPLSRRFHRNLTRSFQKGTQT